MDDLDRAIVNALQDGVEVCDAPFEAPAAALGVTPRELTGRLARLLDEGALTRFGPLYDAQAMGGAFCLCAMSVAPDDVDRVASLVNDFPEVAHNYERDHPLNLWFVTATERPEDTERVVRAIEAATGCRVHALPKLEEYYVGLRLEA